MKKEKNKIYTIIGILILVVFILVIFKFSLTPSGNIIDHYELCLSQLDETSVQTQIFSSCGVSEITQNQKEEICTDYVNSGKQFLNYLSTEMSTICGIINGSGSTPTCGDGECNGDETCLTCPEDCGECPPQQECGNGVIEIGEECDNGSENTNSCNPPYNGICTYCSISCTFNSESGGFCGDGICDQEETCNNCETDCGVCGSENTTFTLTIEATEGTKDQSSINLICTATVSNGFSEIFIYHYNNRNENWEIKETLNSNTLIYTESLGTSPFTWGCKAITIYSNGSIIKEWSSNKTVIDTALLSESGETILGEITDITTKGITELDIKINGSTLNKTIQENQKVELFENNKLLVEFEHDFLESPLDLNYIKLDLGTNYLITDLKLQNDKTKIIYLENKGYDKLCIKDAEINSINEISLSCTEENEINFNDCLENSMGVTKEGITCVENNKIIKIVNLKHSGIRGTMDNTTFCGDGECQTDENCSSCESDCGSCSCTDTEWLCANWSECINNEKTRICLSNCGTMKSEKEFCDNETSTNETTSDKEDNETSFVSNLEISPNNWVVYLVGFIIMIGISAIIYWLIKSGEKEKLKEDIEKIKEHKDLQKKVDIPLKTDEDIPQEKN